MSLALAFFALSVTGLALTGCANKDPEHYERDDYFGGHGNLVRPKHYVPRQVQRY